MLHSPLLRCIGAVLVLPLLASCAGMPKANENPREWSTSPQVEARKFYASGQTVEQFFAAKPAEYPEPGNVGVLCRGLTEAGDEINASRCMHIFDRVEKDYTGPAWNQDVRDHFRFKMIGERERIRILQNLFLLEQGRFKEVEANLMPFMDKESARRAKVYYEYRGMAAPILARAQRNLGGVSEPVARALRETRDDQSLWGAMGAVIYPRALASIVAERECLLGNYEACYGKVARENGQRVGIAELTSNLEKEDAAAFVRNSIVSYARLQALCAYETGRFDEARLAYQDLLAMDDVKSLRSTQRLAHYHLARIAARKGQRQEAVRHLKASIEALESERAAIDSEAGRLGYVTNKGDIYAQLVELLVDLGADAEAFEYAERGKARALLDVLASRRTGTGSAAVVSRAIRSIDEAAAQESSLAAPAAGGGTRRSITVRQEIARAHPQLGALVSATALNAVDVQKRLKPRETLVEYFGEGQRLFAFVVTQGTVKAIRLDAKEVEEQARQFRAKLADGRSRDHQAAGKRLHEAVLAPALAHADSGPLTIVPHGALHYVPFAALHDGRNYLVQKTDLRLLPSASVLPFLGGGTVAGNGLLILGNPDLGKRELDLPAAEQEARTLERINRGARVLLRAEASETALRRLGPQFREIHLAMHGKFDSANAMASGLYMARDADNDGVLSVGELYDLQLNADLVVLSACETALGDSSRGDDVVGLNRGFLFAGAHSIVSSLWEVDDNATRDLMVAFYQQRANHGKAGGLRQAQLAVMKKYPHPYYWAAFQMSGLF